MTNSVIDGIFTLKGARRKIEINTRSAGKIFADDYIATSNGSLIEATLSDDINTLIDNSSDGDAILLPDGYSDTLTPVTADAYHSDPFRGKAVLICGDISWDTGEGIALTQTDTSDRDNPLFTRSGSGTSFYRQLAFLKYTRINNSADNYSSGLVRGNEVGAPTGKATNVLFDLNNQAVAWHYDNPASASIDVRFINCTFFNSSSWLNSYTGRDDVITVSNCLIQDSTPEIDEVIDTNTTVGATLNVDGSYDTTTYSDRGHLYIP